MARVYSRIKSRIGRRQSVIFDRLGVGNPWDGESTDDPIGLGSMSLLFENRRSPAPHLSTPDKARAKSTGNPAIEKYRDRSKSSTKARSGSGTISVSEVRRSVSGARVIDAPRGAGKTPELEIPVSNAAAPLRHRVVPAPESGRGRIRFRHPDKK